MRNEASLSLRVVVKLTADCMHSSVCIGTLNNALVVIRIVQVNGRGRAIQGERAFDAVSTERLTKAVKDARKVSFPYFVVFKKAESLVRRDMRLHPARLM